MRTRDQLCPTQTTMSNTQHDEHQYLSLIRNVLETGDVRPDRTGTGTLSLFAPPNLRFSLADATLPLLTTKRTFLRGIVEELLWFVQGATDSRLLSAKGIKIWDGNGSKEFLEKRGLGHRREGDLGPVYGFQWRHFGAKYEDCDKDYSGEGVDQLRECIRKIKEDPTDRRIILSAWNPAGESAMSLTVESSHILSLRHPPNGAPAMSYDVPVLRAPTHIAVCEAATIMPHVPTLCRPRARHPV
jgi:thymidylate synthase